MTSWPYKAISSWFNNICSWRLWIRLSIHLLVWFCWNTERRWHLDTDWSHCACIIEVGHHVNLLRMCCTVACSVWRRVDRLSCPGFSRAAQGGSRVVVGCHGVFSFFLLLLCLLGGLAQAGLPQGFRAIYRHTAPFIWWRQSRAELAHSFFFNVTKIQP